MVFSLVKRVLAQAIFALFKKEWLYEKYIIFKDVWSRNCCAWHKPIFFCNLFSTVFMQYFQKRFHPTSLLWILWMVFFSITLFLIFNVGNSKGILNLIEYVWNNIFFVFSIFSNNLFALNHWLIFFNSQFTFSKRIFIWCVVCKHWVWYVWCLIQVVYIDQK